jgi:hypothetical protein
MLVTIRLPRFASSTYTLEDRKSLATYLQMLLERTITGVRVEHRTDRGVVITARWEGDAESGALAAGGAILDLIDRALEGDLQARAPRRQLALIIAQVRRATVAIDPE